VAVGEGNVCWAAIVRPAREAVGCRHAGVRRRPRRHHSSFAGRYRSPCRHYRRQLANVRFLVCLRA